MIPASVSRVSQLRLQAAVFGTLAFCRGLPFSAHNIVGLLKAGRCRSLAVDLKECTFFGGAKPFFALLSCCVDLCQFSTKITPGLIEPGLSCSEFNLYGLVGTCLCRRPQSGNKVAGRTLERYRQIRVADGNV